MLDFDQFDSLEFSAKTVEISDNLSVGLKFGFIGVGQGGCNIASAFYDQGYRRVILVNTTSKDVDQLDVPDENVLIGKGMDGAGKQVSVGMEQISSLKNELITMFQDKIGDGVDFCFICVGLGGGTGTGGIVPIAHSLRDWINNKDSNTKIGIIYSVPSTDEGGLVCSNAEAGLLNIENLLSQGVVSSTFPLDNSKLRALTKNASIVNKWINANKVVSSLFSVFNILSKQSSRIGNFDPKDYLSALNHKELTAGTSAIECVFDEKDIADVISKIYNHNLLNRTAFSPTSAALVLTGSKQVLESVSSESVDRAKEYLVSLCGKDSVIHTGVYINSEEKLRLFVMFGK